jgi:hypothetical protein
MFQRSLASSFLVGAVALLGLSLSRLAADEAQPEAAPVKLAGHGDKASAKFTLQAGLSTWAVRHNGTSNFQISLVDQDGNEASMPVNEIGRFRGTLLVRVAKSGEYLLNVKADGNWTVAIRQPRPTNGEAKPVSRIGQGPDVPVFVTLPKGLTVFRVKHDGDGIFRVKLFDRDGKLVEQLFGQTGRYEGSRAFRVEQEGIYAVGVYANGNWSLKIE